MRQRKARWRKTHLLLILTLIGFFSSQSVRGASNETNATTSSPTSTPGFVLISTPIGTENGNCADVSCNWGNKTLSVYLDSVPSPPSKVLLQFKAKVTSVRDFDYDFFGVNVFVNGHGGYQGNNAIWIHGGDYEWYTLAIPLDLDGDGIDWKSGYNEVKISTWSDYDSRASITGVDVIKSVQAGMPTPSPTPKISIINCAPIAGFATCNGTKNQYGVYEIIARIYSTQLKALRQVEGALISTPIEFGYLCDGDEVYFKADGKVKCDDLGVCDGTKLGLLGTIKYRVGDYIPQLSLLCLKRHKTGAWASYEAQWYDMPVKIVECESHYDCKLPDYICSLGPAYKCVPAPTSTPPLSSDQKSQHSIAPTPIQTQAPIPSATAPTNNPSPPTITQSIIEILQLPYIIAGIIAAAAGVVGAIYSIKGYKRRL